MGQIVEKLVQEDINVGTDVTWVTAPGGGSLFSTQVGLHTFARNQGEYTAAWTPGAITAGSKASTTVTVPNASVADFILASHDKILTSDLRISGHVSAAGTVKVVIHNPTASTVTVPAGTVSVLVFPVLAQTPASPPTCTITAPSGSQLGDLSVSITVSAADAVYGIANVKVWWQYCPGGICGSTTLLATLTTAPYTVTWTFPSCGDCPLDLFVITAQSTNTIGNTSSIATKSVRLIGRGC